jgi:prepilin-type N-terminal cleavage/methylation domain-containing protein
LAQLFENSLKSHGASDIIVVMVRKALAFTLPEMLAVIALIVIILAMLLPSLRQGRRVAQDAICVESASDRYWCSELWG